jgi:hypothetical protein
VALDASIDEGGRWVAQTSTRRVAAHLGMTPGAAGRALARLCAHGLVAREDRRHAATGRFLESVYVVAPVPGFAVLSGPCSTSPRTVELDTDQPSTTSRNTVAGDDGRQFDQLTLLASPDPTANATTTNHSTRNRIDQQSRIQPVRPTPVAPCTTTQHRLSDTCHVSDEAWSGNTAGKTEASSC